MKKIKLLSALFVLCGTISLTSCSSDDSEPVNNPPSSQGTFTVTMDGESFIATEATAVQEDGTTTITGIRGGNGEKITLIIQATSPGTFTTSQMEYVAEENGSPYVNFDMLGMDYTGSVTITSVTGNSISGAFNFVGYNAGTGSDIEFTNGEFNNIPLTVVPDPNHTGNGIITAKIEGVTTTFTDITASYSEGYLILSGQNAETIHMVSISVPENITAGSYNVNPNPLFGNTIIIGNVNSPVTSIIGAFNIYNYGNGWIDGYFVFTGNDADGNMIMVTEGEFHAPLN